MSSQGADNGRQILYISLGIMIVLIAGLTAYSAFRDRKNSPALNSTQPSQTVDWSGWEDGGDWEDGPIQSDDEKFDEDYQQVVALRQPEARLQLSCDDVGAYSGAYVEDGSDEPVENVAAILITNRSGKYLTLARLTYQLDGESALFEVTDLPAGKSVWILEKNRRKATDDSKYVYKEAVTSFADHITRTPKELKVEYAENMLRVTNISDQTLNHVMVHYKGIHKDGHYLGGITYKLDFGTLEPGDSVEKIAGHYDNDWSVLLRIVFEEADVDDS